MNTLILAVLAVCWITPDHYPPWTAFHTEVAGFLAAVIALVVCAIWNMRRIKIPLAVFVILALAATGWVQYWVGLLTYGGDALLVTVYLLSYAAAWLWGYQWVETKQKQIPIESVSVFLCFVGLLTAFQITVQWLQLEPYFGGWVIDGLKGGRPRANVGQPNQAATMLMMGSVGVAILREREKINSAVMWLALITLMLGTVLTQSRTALLSAVLVVAVFLVVCRKKPPTGIRRHHAVIWLIVLCGSAWVYSSGVGFETTAPTPAGQMGAIGTRPQIWAQLIAAVQAHPWAGWGWLQTAEATQYGSLSFPGLEQATFAHNVILDGLVMLGIPITVILLCLAGYWLKGRIHRIREVPEAGAAFFALIPFVVHSMLEFPHAYVYFLIIAGLLLGSIDAYSGEKKSIVLAVPKSAVLFVAIVYSSLLIAIALEYLAAEEDFRVNRFENVRLGETSQDYRPPNLVLLTQLSDMAKAMRLRAKPGMKPEELALLKRTSKRYSWARLMYRTALALALNDRPEEATNQLKVIKGLFGDDVYREAKDSFVALQIEEYPQLRRVQLP